MEDKASRRDAVKAYKERQEVGGLYRIVNAKTGWKGPVVATPNLAGIRNRFEFGKKTGACFDSSVAEQWAKEGGTDLEFLEVERLERKPEQSPEDFKEELSALLALWNAGE